MLTRNEIERLALAIHGLRPGWPVESLKTFIQRRETRPLLDLTIELAWVAQLADTKTPARIDEDGPWKRAVRTADPTPTVQRIDPIGGCHECMRPHDDHHGADHEWVRPTLGVPMPDHVRQALNQKEPA